MHLTIRRNFDYALSHIILTVSFSVSDISIEDMEKIFETTAETICCSEECLIDKVNRSHRRKDKIDTN